MVTLFIGGFIAGFLLGVTVMLLTDLINTSKK